MSRDILCPNDFNKDSDKIYTCLNRGHHNIPVVDLGLSICLVICECGNIPSRDLQVNFNTLKSVWNKKREIMERIIEVPTDKSDQYI